jgi:hypothetical protein
MAPRIRFNLAGFSKVRKSAGVEGEVRKHTNRVRDEANQSSGGGYVSRVSNGRTRSRGVVATGDGNSMRDNARNNTLVKKLRP